MKALDHKAQTRWMHRAIMVFIGTVCTLWVIPLIMIVSASFTQESTLVNTGYQLVPPKFSLEAYRWLWNDPSILLNAYGVTIVVTSIGTFAGVMIMALLAYAISRTDFRLRHVVTFLVFFTMLFNGGLVPYYINMSRVLGVKDTIWAMILPYLVTPFYVLLLRTYFYTLPRDLFDAARVDGAGEVRIFFQIVVPLSTPALATVALFTMLQYWNDMYQALLFTASKSTDGDLIVVYIPQDRQIHLNLNTLPDDLSGIWFDPKSGTRQSAELDGGHLTTPAPGDWVLVLSHALSLPAGQGEQS